MASQTHDPNQCWFCGSREKDETLRHKLTKGEEGKLGSESVLVEVPRCEYCRAAHRLAFGAGCGLFVLGGIAAITTVVILFVTSGAQSSSGGRGLVMLLMIPVVILIASSYFIILKVKGTRSQYLAQTYPEILELQKQGFRQTR